ncbi:hypothetical protein CC1G_01402 [Coprinopsis cinerea okayama7|uniref:C2H2-type domain-containing protein n=1 Tax=Coprinopsis cinerea (strain Okayama-7 / 130 / ATCC MYA-4618 / FGSC 9003) TaxID=240176 RepID=A8NYQ2_COPC7|nr:hypothetical protein CC1G_01402 [Coprinopsis cinerea okayama7\|eukprot:XP_001837490.2 hypothetical protein CC1G_01402 [Coprinopsis cinerea okayama7\
MAKRTPTQEEIALLIKQKEAGEQAERLLRELGITTDNARTSSPSGISQSPSLQPGHPAPHGQQTAMAQASVTNQASVFTPPMRAMVPHFHQHSVQPNAVQTNVNSSSIAEAFKNNAQTAHMNRLRLMQLQNQFKAQANFGGPHAHQNQRPQSAGPVDLPQTIRVPEASARPATVSTNQPTLSSNAFGHPNQSTAPLLPQAASNQQTSVPAANATTRLPLPFAFQRAYSRTGPTTVPYGSVLTSGSQHAPQHPGPNPSATFTLRFTGLSKTPPLHLPRLNDFQLNDMKRRIAEWKQGLINRNINEAYFDFYEAFGYNRGWRVCTNVSGTFIQDENQTERIPVESLYRSLEKNKLPPAVGASTHVGAAPVQSTSTPSPSMSTTSISTRSPREANKKSLAKDLLNALGKRARTGGESVSAPAAKRMATGVNGEPSTPCDIRAISPTQHGESPQLLSKPSGASIPPTSVDDLPPQEAPTSHGDVLPQVLQAIPPTEQKGTAVFPENNVPITLSSSATSPVNHFPSPEVPPIVSLPEPDSTPPPESRPSAPMVRSTPVVAPSSRSSSHKSHKDDPSAHSVAHSTPPPQPPPTSDEEEPLFLPSTSAPSSPVTTPFRELPGNDDGGVQLASKRKPRGGGKSQVYVLIPPAPSHIRRDVKALRKQAKRRAEKGKGREVVAIIDIVESDAEDDELSDEGYDYSYDAQGNRIEDQADRDLLKVASTRLQAIPCGWDSCEVVMNSVASLLEHLERHHRPPNLTKGQTFPCHWTRCGRQCKKGDRHLLKHAFDHLVCPIEGCDESFRTVRALQRHCDCDHGKDDSFKRRWNPTQPNDARLKELEPPPCPGILPAYRVEPLIVRPAPIPEEEHRWRAPEVKRIITGLEKPRQHKTRSIRVRVEHQDDDSVQVPVYRYEYLTDYPKRYGYPQSEPAEGFKFDPLPTEEVLEDIRHGLVILDNRPESPRPPPSTGSSLDREMSPEIPPPLPFRAVNAGTAASGNGGEHQEARELTSASDDESAVAFLLSTP